jgi:hypothetical protein
VTASDDLDLGVQLRAEQETNLLLAGDHRRPRAGGRGPVVEPDLLRGGVEFSGVGRRMIVDLCRAIAVVNPLVKRGLMLRIAYIWGGGVQVAARDEKVGEVVGDFWDDNTRSLTGTQAQEELERCWAPTGTCISRRSRRR